MMRPKRAFTLIELLVVIAIIAILAAILFPVFAEAKTSAKQTVWLSNFKQSSTALVMYAADNDDYVPPANVNGKVGGYFYCFGCGRPDFIWVELIQPYTREWTVFRSPVDPNAKDDRLARDPFTDAPLPRSHPNYFYAWASRSNIGLNYLFLSPWYANSRTAGSQPISLSRVERPSSTIQQIDTLWDRSPNSGAPIGGGNWVAEAPCARDTAGNWLIPFAVLNEWYSYGGWRPNPAGTRPFSWLEFGGAWPWFRKRNMVAMLDSSAKSLPLGRITAGCDVRPFFGGPAFDGELYLWDLR